jgi:endoglucanase
MLWCQPLEWHIKKIHEIGFNYIRVPISEDLIMSNWDTLYPGDGIVNPNFPEHGMRSIEILDLFFDLTLKYNMSVIMDIHRLNPSSQAPKPFIDNTIYTFVRFMDAWVRILDRYQDRPNLLGVDVFNEYQSDDWNDWIQLAQITINHIQAKFPGRFHYYIEGSRWGGDLSGARSKPITDLENTTYSVHKYWFSDTDIVNDQNRLIDSWEYSFGFLNQEVMVGEWGYISEDGKQSQWATWFVEYLRTKNIRDTFFWAWNFDSGDTKGVLMDDCWNVNQGKIDLLHHLWDTSA